MSENQAPKIPMLNRMILEMYGMPIIVYGRELVETTVKISELEHKKFGKKKFADEVMKQCSALYDKNHAMYMGFYKDKELLQGEEECTNIMSALYFDIGMLALKNINIVKQIIGEPVEETEEFAQRALNAFLEFEDLYRKFEKMSKAFVPVDTMKNEKVTKLQQKVDKPQEPRALGVKDFADFAKRFNDELLSYYVFMGQEVEKLKNKHFRKQKRAKELMQDFAHIGDLSLKAFNELDAKTKYAQGDGVVYSTSIALLLFDLSVMANANAANLQATYFDENIELPKEFMEQLAKAYYEFKETYSQFIAMSQKYNIIFNEKM